MITKEELKEKVYNAKLLNFKKIVNDLKKLKSNGACDLENKATQLTQAAIFWACIGNNPSIKDREEVTEEIAKEALKCLDE